MIWEIHDLKEKKKGRKGFSSLHEQKSTVLELVY